MHEQQSSTAIANNNRHHNAAVATMPHHCKPHTAYSTSYCNAPQAHKGTQTDSDVCTVDCARVTSDSAGQEHNARNL